MILRSVPIETRFEPLDQLVFALAILFISLSCICLVCFTLFVLLAPDSFAVKLTGPRRPAKLENGETVEQNIRRWCWSLERGYKPSWWLPKWVDVGVLANLQWALSNHLLFARDGRGGPGQVS